MIRRALALLVLATLLPAGAAAAGASATEWEVPFDGRALR
jgi:hypothetical protein